ncbi:MAG TPA: YtxH domain-containing protein [Blastocatellia bacterium]|nr:YtxH domain-containing protein [Blastocatellia bacterium]
MSENQGGGGGDKLVYFLVGAGIGAITALLFAPKSGSELRSDLADATRKGLDYARDTGREIGERATEVYQTGVERASDLTTRGKEAVGDLTDRGKDMISRQKGQFTAAIEAGKQGYREAKKADQSKVSAAVEES